MTSKRTRSGGRRTRASFASAMLPATSASKPSRARCVTRGSEIAFSSSTSRMRGFTAQMVAAGRGSRFCQSCIGGPRSATNAARDESGSGWPGRGPCPPHVREVAMSASSTTLRGLPLESSPLGLRETPWVHGSVWADHFRCPDVAVLGLSIVSRRFKLSSRTGSPYLLWSAAVAASRASVSPGVWQVVLTMASAGGAGSGHGLPDPIEVGPSRILWIPRLSRELQAAISALTRASTTEASDAQRSGRVCRLSQPRHRLQCVAIHTACHMSGRTSGLRRKCVPCRLCQSVSTRLYP